MRGLPHLLMQLRAAACTPSRSPGALSVPNSAVPRLRGLPIRKPVGCNYPSGGGRVAVNITSSQMVVASIKLGLVGKKREREMVTIFRASHTTRKKPSVTPVLQCAHDEAEERRRECAPITGHSQPRPNGQNEFHPFLGLTRSTRTARTCRSRRSPSASQHAQSRISPPSLPGRLDSSCSIPY